MPLRTLTVALLVLLLVIAWTVSSAPGPTPALAAALDTDRDGVTDALRGCLRRRSGELPDPAGRIDDVFAGRSEDRDGRPMRPQPAHP
jgi:hypothetical protein